jgi:hypothetical protein
MTTDSWLELSNQVDSKPLTQEEQHSKAVEFAKTYVEAFVLNPAGAKLLQHWDTTLLRYRIPVNATINEYAAVEARRAWVQQIYNQIEFAQSNGRLTRG